MINPEKIEAWIKEAAERPESAPVILQFIANRLSDLAQRNEQLAAENIALMTDKRVEEYEQRISHLEYQLDLLKRQFGGDLSAAEALQSAESAGEIYSLLLFDAGGRVQRIALPNGALQPGPLNLRLGLPAGGEPLRLLAAAPAEELMLVFSSGRLATTPVKGLPALRPAPAGQEPPTAAWEQAAVPEEPRAGETLVCVAPVSKIALAEYLVQASRRGFVKKIRAQMAQSILANRYIGAGVKTPADRSLALVLTGRDDRLALVSHEGYLQCLDVRKLPFAIEEALRLGPSDHLVAALPLAGLENPPDPPRAVLVMTQLGKAVVLNEIDIETAASPKTRGAPVYSAQRRGQGVRVVGAAAARPGDWAAALDAAGGLALYPAAELLDRGTLPAPADLLAFTCFTPPGRPRER